MLAATQTQNTAIDPAIAAQGAAKQAAIMKSARDFESVFATEMLTPMYEGVEVDPTFGGGHGEEMFRTMLLDQYGKQMAANDSFGMVHQIADTLLKAQEGKH